MKTLKYVDVEVDVAEEDLFYVGEDFYPGSPMSEGAYDYDPTYSSVTSEALIVPPRYNDVEFGVQRLEGSHRYDVVVEGLDRYPSTAEMYGAASVLTTVDDADWTEVIRAVSVNGDVTRLGTIPAQYGFYRAIVTSDGDVTVRFTVVGMTE